MKKEESKDSWEEEFEKNFRFSKVGGDPEVNKKVDDNTTAIKFFIRNLLVAQKEEIIKETRLEINNWISTDKDGNEYLSPEDLKNLIKALHDRFNPKFSNLER